MNRSAPFPRSVPGQSPIPRYANGRIYAPPRSLCAFGQTPIFAGPFRAVLDLRQAALPWTLFWEVIQRELRAARFRIATLRVYRQVLRSFKAFLDSRPQDDGRSPSGPPPPLPVPGDVSAELTEEFIHHIVARQRSASWLATNISVLRTAFDKLGGLALTRRLVSPKRPEQLPDVLAPAEIRSLIAAAPTPRDRLLIGLLYGCGLKVSELCALRWSHLDIATRLIRLPGRGMSPARQLALPEPLLNVLARGTRECQPDAFVFPGRGAGPLSICLMAKQPGVVLPNEVGRPLSERTAERVVSRAARSAGLLKPVCCMTLRHSYAVARLRAGDNIRDIQESLGHRHVETTLLYERYLATDSVTSPAERLNVTFNPAPGQKAAECSRSSDPESTIRNPQCSPPSFDLQIDPATVELPFPEIPGGWRAFLAWFKTRISRSQSAPHTPPDTPPDTG